MTRRAVIYCRISKDRAGGGLGVSRQEEDCRKLAASLGWEVVALHVDNDLSAYSGKPRPGYRALLEDLDTGRADAVLAWHTDRLHRSPRELEAFVDVCERHDVVTHTVTAGQLDLSTPAGRMVARQLGAVARYEVEQGVRRMKRAKRQAAAAGKWLGGPRPFGWETDGTVVLGEAEALRRWTTEVLAGVSIASLTREANAAGLLTTTGKTWTATEVRRVLTRARNAGLVEHQGQILDGVTSGWPAVVPEDEWRAVRAFVLDPARRTNPSPARKHLGAGLYLCGKCADGTTMTSGTATSGGPRYRCRASHHLSRRSAPVDDVVVGTVVELLSQSIEDLSRFLPAETELNDRDRQAESQAARLRIEQLAEEFGAGRLPLTAFTAGTTAAQAIINEHDRYLATRAAGTALSGVIDAPSPAAEFARLWEVSRGEDPAAAAAALGKARSVVETLVVVTILPQHRGRPAGWTKGQVVFDPNSVHIDMKGRS